MATGLPWPGELETLKKGVAWLIGQEAVGYKEVNHESDDVQTGQTTT